MEYLIEIKLDKDELNIETDFKRLESKKLSLYYRGLAEEVAKQALQGYQSGTLNEFLNEGDFDNFLFFVVDNNKELIEIYNDHFGSNEIYYHHNHAKDKVIITDDTFRIHQGIPKLSDLNLCEFITFQGIMPPDTIFKDIYCVASGSKLVVNGASLEQHEYWDIEKLLSDKINSYEELIDEGDSALVETVRRHSKEGVKTAVGLSGGVDSGGLLGMCVQKTQSRPVAISVGGRGPETVDLISARKSVEYHKVKHHEIYPNFENMKKIWSNNIGLSHPVQGAAAFGYSLVNEKAKQEGAKNVYYGFGAEMILGNSMKLAKVAHTLRFEKYVPNIILKPIYKFFGPMFIKSETRQRFLEAGDDWVKRFVISRCANYFWSKKYLKVDGEACIRQAEKKISRHFSSKLSIYDALVKLYVKSWVNYLQYRDMTAIAKKFSVTPVIPFDTLRVAKVFFKIPLAHRKRNKWKKQLIRDIFKPYIPEHLYSNVARAISVPYTQIFGDKLEAVLGYVETSRIFSSQYDFDLMRKQLRTEPEPGFLLMFLFGAAVWYDANFCPERKSDFDKLFD